jgi:hypothetical protein
VHNGAWLLVFLQHFFFTTKNFTTFFLQQKILFFLQQKILQHFFYNKKYNKKFFFHVKQVSARSDPQNVDLQEIERTKTPNKILSGRVVGNALKRMPVNF